MDHIEIRGARTHNLQSVDVDIPRERLVVITGPSGSGKSSLAFDTLFAEGRRRYVESLSVHARQVLGPAGRPDVDRIDGLSPALAIEQRAVPRTPRSTVGTLTEIDDHLRLLFARAGVAHCPRCGDPVVARTVPEIVDAFMALGEGARVSVMSPAVTARKGTHDTLFEAWRREGFVRARVDGAVVALDEMAPLDAKKPHDVDLVIDRVQIKSGARTRVLDAVELALRHGQGMLRMVPAEGAEQLLSERYACAKCGITLPPMEPALFSFNNPDGACPACQGLGIRDVADVATLVPDASKSLRQGALSPFRKSLPADLVRYARGVGVDLDAPWNTLPARAREEIFYGDDEGWPGVLAMLEAKDRDDEEAETATRWRIESTCDVCHGKRLRPEALAVTLGGRSIADVSSTPVRPLGQWVASLALPDRVAAVVDRVRHEVAARLAYLDGVGLPYLTLQRTAATLSRGETQRVRLATQLGGQLSGVLYVLDEPTVGLHPRDGARLFEAVKALVARGNSAVLVEHDLDIVRACDHVIDMGPGAGTQGGRVVGEGTPTSLATQPNSVTGPWLSGARAIGWPTSRRPAKGTLRITNARRNNLQGVTVTIPLGCLVAVTGVSGSGKSSLILGGLVPLLQRRLQGQPDRDPLLGTLEGGASIERLIPVDDAPLGRTPRSTPATYMGILSQLRELYATMPEARARGFKAARFSYNVKGGRCELCQGEGVQRVEMHFLPDVQVVCPACHGARYEPETLTVTYRGRSIAEVLALTVDAASEVFEAIPKVRDLLWGLREVGLGYLKLGQPANTLSGGEAQRVKLARELSRRSHGRTMYVLDEPTAGLHLSDIEVLLHLFERLVEQGNTVLVVEHQMDIVGRADHVIDIGPDGGDGGGRLVVEGPPEVVRDTQGSYTGAALRATTLTAATR